MSEKLKKTISGGTVGAICGATLHFFQCLCAEITCSSIDSEVTVGIFVISILTGTIIGFFVGVIADKEKIVLEEQRRFEAERNKFNAWDNKLSNYFYDIEKRVSDYNLNIDMGALYEPIWQIEKQTQSMEQKYKEQFKKRLQIHQNYLENVVLKNVTEITGPYNTKIALKAIFLLKAATKNDAGFDPAIASLKEFYDCSYSNTNYIYFKKYGDCNLPLDDPDIMNYMDSNIREIEKKIKNKINKVKDNSNGYFKGIAENLHKDLLEDAASVMWYYAKKKPFEVDKYNTAKQIYNIYADFNSDEDETSVKVEVVLSKIYAKNQLGGIGIVRQDLVYIDKWLEAKIKNNWIESCYLLASGLAFMELYEIERDILRKLVSLGIKIDAELQERLSFLESGGTSNVTIYDVDSNGDFIFDNSSVDWNTNEFDIFFRKIAMKNINLKYSLAINKWTKTIPLSSGQKVSKDDIYHEFTNMVKDFDGEVTCRKTYARAINLENLEYEDAVIFEFKSKRNKCISILFSSDKYGRNLNLTIITLFTPEEKISVDEMKKYALAINQNIYVDSFRESILQSLDFVLKEEKSVYDEYPSSKNIFE